jgi:hypothetical protein
MMYYKLVDASTIHFSIKDKRNIIKYEIKLYNYAITPAQNTPYYELVSQLSPKIPVLMEVFISKSEKKMVSISTRSLKIYLKIPETELDVARYFFGLKSKFILNDNEKFYTYKLAFSEIKYVSIKVTEDNGLYLIIKKRCVNDPKIIQSFENYESSFMKLLEETCEIINRTYKRKICFLKDEIPWDKDDQDEITEKLLAQIYHDSKGNLKEYSKRFYNLLELRLI